MTDHWVVAGAGLTGALAAIRLARAGHQVDLVEKRSDLRHADVHAGRSINLAMSVRGLDALDRVGLGDAIRAEGIPMRGRIMHALDGDLTFQPYGLTDEQSILSVSRDKLNSTLLDAVDAEPNITTWFNHGVTDVDLDTGAVTLGPPDSEAVHLSPDAVIGADGAYSKIRSKLQRSPRFDYEQDYLEHGYKELTIPANDDGTHRMDPHALHIWPRGAYMMIALPNPDGTFTCTLFWPFDGEVGFERINKPEEILSTFAQHFPDVDDLMPDLVHDYQTNPTSTLVTIRCHPWHHDDRILLLGDAAHAVVPFYGQGANASMEDVTIFMEQLAAHPTDRHEAFATFENMRKPDADAIADLAIDNFIEMRDHVGSRWFLFKKANKARIARAFPSYFEPLYTMVTFSRRPYAEAVAKAKRQDQLLTIVVLAIMAIIVAFLIGVLLWVL